MRNLESISERRKELKSKVWNLRKDILKIRFSYNTELTKKERTGYESHNSMMESLRSISKKLSMNTPQISEKDYLIMEKKKNLSFTKKVLVRLDCEEKGHIETNKTTTLARTYVKCSRCDAAYNRQVNSKESSSFYEMMQKSFNI